MGGVAPADPGLVVRERVKGVPVLLDIDPLPDPVHEIGVLVFNNH